MLQKICKGGREEDEQEEGQRVKRRHVTGGEETRHVRKRREGKNGRKKVGEIEVVE